jgi:hypothetical protein
MSLVGCILLLVRERDKASCITIPSKTKHCGIPRFLGWLLAAAAAVAAAAAAATQGLRVYYVRYRKPHHSRHYLLSVTLSMFSPQYGLLIYVLGLTRRVRTPLFFVSVCDSFSILQLIRGNIKKRTKKSVQIGRHLLQGPFV